MSKKNKNRRRKTANKSKKKNRESSANKGSDQNGLSYGAGEDMYMFSFSSNGINRSYDCAGEDQQFSLLKQMLSEAQATESDEVKIIVQDLKLLESHVHLPPSVLKLTWDEMEIEEFINELFISEDGTVIVSSMRSSVSLFDMEAHRLIRTYKSPHSPSAPQSDNGSSSICDDNKSNANYESASQAKIMRCTERVFEWEAHDPYSNKICWSLKVAVTETYICDRTISEPTRHRIHLARLLCPFARWGEIRSSQTGDRYNDGAEIQNLTESDSRAIAYEAVSSESTPRALEAPQYPITLWRDGETFLWLASDRLKQRGQKTASIWSKLETTRKPVFGDGCFRWKEKMEDEFINEIEHPSRRPYCLESCSYNDKFVQSLVDAFRNSKIHFTALSEDIIKRRDLYAYFSSKFPELIPEVYKVFSETCSNEYWFENFRLGAAMTWLYFQLLQEIINDEDDRLKGLRKDLGNEVYEAVIDALRQIIEYNQSGRHIISELWNFNEGRRASLKEGVSFFLELWEAAKSPPPPPPPLS